MNKCLGKGLILHKGVLEMNVKDKNGICWWGEKTQRVRRGWRSIVEMKEGRAVISGKSPPGGGFTLCGDS